MITNYTTLQAEIALWLMRGDLGSIIPSFIQNAEAVLKRRLVGAPLKVDTLDVDQRLVALPADCRYIRTLVISMAEEEPWTPRPTSIEEIATLLGPVSGKPTYYAIAQGFVYFAPAPDAIYTADIFYEETLSLATSPTGTNGVLTAWPDVYLYGALVEAAPYLKAETRLPMWEARFNRVLQEIRLSKEREAYGGATTKRRLSNPLGT